MASAEVPTGDSDSAIPVSPDRLSTTPPTSRRVWRNTSRTGTCERCGSSIHCAPMAGATIITATSTPISLGSTSWPIIQIASVANRLPPDRLPMLYQPPALPRSSSGSDAAMRPPLQLPTRPEISCAANPNAR
ncbi:MAG: hypothetical protein E6J90_38250 [Deltaproteobacteria bacterium]|nr:MAG: hypothetical protein E6J90_38250 [Deltaproteobacteria bacterium]